MVNARFRSHVRSGYSDASGGHAELTEKEYLAPQSSMNGYWSGPGGWVYSVSGSSVTIIWSPSTRGYTRNLLDSSTAAKVLAELKASGKKHSTEANAVAAGIAAAPIRSSGGSAGGVPAPGASAGAGDETPLWQNPWVLGGGAAVVLAVVLGIAFWPVSSQKS